MQKCSVLTCPNSRPIIEEWNTSVTFHPFPKKSSIKKLWCESIGRPGWIPSSDSIVCSDHFPMEAFYITNGGERRLHCNGIPSISHTSEGEKKCAPNIVKFERASIHEDESKSDVMELNTMNVNTDSFDDPLIEEKPLILTAGFLEEMISNIVKILDELVSKDPDSLRADRVKSDILKALSCYQEIIERQYDLVDLKIERCLENCDGDKRGKNFKMKKKSSYKRIWMNDEDLNNLKMELGLSPSDNEMYYEPLLQSEYACNDDSDDDLPLMQKQTDVVDDDPKFKQWLNDLRALIFENTRTNQADGTECSEANKGFYICFDSDCEKSEPKEDHTNDPETPPVLCKRRGRKRIVQCEDGNEQKKERNTGFRRMLRKLRALRDNKDTSAETSNGLDEFSCSENSECEVSPKKSKKQDAEEDSDGLECINERLEIPIPRYSCVECDVSYVHQYYLEYHHNNCKGRILRGWLDASEEQLQMVKGVCPICGTKMAKVTNLKRHMILHKFHQLKPSDFNAVSKDTLENNAVVELYNSNENCLNNKSALDIQNRLSNTDEIVYASRLVARNKNASTMDPICNTEITEENLGLNYSVKSIVYKTPDEVIGKKDTFKCDICKRKFSKRDVLETHVRLVHVEKLKPIICNHCPKTFNILFNLTKHVKEFHRVKMRDGKNYYLANGENLKNRQYPKNIEFKVFACKLCPNIYPSLRQLKDHSERNHLFGKSQSNPASIRFPRKKNDRKIKCINMKYPCPDCDKVYLSYGGLSEHLESHSDMPPSTCDVCGKMFKARNALLRHVQRHNGPQFICDQCGSSHTSSGNLQRHKRLHSGEKNYKCNDCGKTFTTSDSLKVHYRIHTGEKPWSCDMCDSKFSERRRWLIHVNNHKGIKPYKCQAEQCTKAFVDKKKLNKHMLEHVDSRNTYVNT